VESVMARLDDNDQTELFDESKFTEADSPVFLTTGACLRASDGESVGCVGGIVVGGSHAPETFGMIGVFFAEIVGEPEERGTLSVVGLFDCRCWYCIAYAVLD
jgi:hypothetical protein